MKKITFSEIEGWSSGYLALLAILGAIVLVGLGSAFYMEHHGHYVTGMNNQIVWGVPHVFAVFLIVAASGALNTASISSVFGKVAYKPLARMSALLSIALLVGGLMVLVLDLGRADRLIVAMTKYNFKSIFAWNMILYNGFFAIVGAYLWMLMDARLGKKFARPVGFFAFLWRLALTTGTGSIFGFLVARQAYDAAIMAPMFVVMSFSFGLAILLLILLASYKWSGREFGDALFTRLKNLLGIFVAGVLYFVIAYHLTNLYAAEHTGVEHFILLNGGIYSNMFWYGQILLGSLVPLALFYHPTWGKSRLLVGLGAALVIIGGWFQMYVIIIGGQAFPLVLFPGKTVESSFSDGIINSYTPTLAEFGLGLGGFATALIAVALAVKVLRLMPTSLADADVDPHYKK